MCTQFTALRTAVIDQIAVWLFRAGRRVDRARLTSLLSTLLRRVGPWLPEHRVGRANLAAAFPEKSTEERDRILLGTWENLGRFAAEFIHLDRLWDYDRTNSNSGTHIETTPSTLERLNDIARRGKPVLIFTGHLGNWELTALGARAEGLDLAILYRRPNFSAIADEIINLRRGGMGTLIPSGPKAPLRLYMALRRGQHVAMLVDQYLQAGVDVIFFGRHTKANPLIAQLARYHQCPIYGARSVRLPGDRFRVELTDAIVLPRDVQGGIDVQATMQVITSILEGWVREYPEQWLWLHRRWR
ncbi:MAG: lipid A biosynthesis lauroyl acyltransferase [Steroidobacteraceae bacterium]